MSLRNRGWRRRRGKYFLPGEGSEKRKEKKPQGGVPNAPGYFPRIAGTVIYLYKVPKSLKFLEEFRGECCSLIHGGRKRDG